MGAEFIGGLRLAGEFFAEVVRPLLAGRVAYAAALVGAGSEVAGFDSARSTDHDWGPRLHVFVEDDADAETIGAMLDAAMLDGSMPAEFRGYPVAFPVTREPGRSARHRVEVSGLGGWLHGQLGFDPRQRVSTLDWLATPTQRLAEVTGGAVFHDEPGELTRARAALAWYPRDVWLRILACQWQRIAEEEAFPGRCAEVGDELGSAVVTARLARDLIRLCLLMHRRYPPYSKWLGSAFARLPGIGAVSAPLTAAVTAADWPHREENLCLAYQAVAALHNRLGITEPLDTRVRRYYDRPYLVIGAERFAAALAGPGFGAVDQFIDNTGALGDIGFLRACTRAGVHTGEREQ